MGFKFGKKGLLKKIFGSQMDSCNKSVKELERLLKYTLYA